MHQNEQNVGPLSGVTVVDLTRVLAGPYCTMVLYDLGATVIKVEAPGTGDDARHIGPFIKGTSAYFSSLNRGKQSIALNLKDADDKQVFEKLLERADVLVENYRPGTMEKLGYGFETLHAKYPKLIYAAASGFGQTGPYRARAAYDMVVQGMGGIMSVTGHEGAPPTRVGTSIGDITAGLFTAIGINAALYHRTQTGEGTMIDVAMLDCQVAILETRSRATSRPANRPARWARGTHRSRRSPPTPRRMGTSSSPQATTSCSPTWRRRSSGPSCWTIRVSPATMSAARTSTRWPSSWKRR